LIGFTPKDLQVGLSRELSKILKCFFIDKLFGVVAAAIQGNVYCVDHVSHLIALIPFICAIAYWQFNGVNRSPFC
jgi:hypothetical protein